MEIEKIPETKDEEDDGAIIAEESVTEFQNNMPSFTSDGRYHNKQRCLVLCSRGVTARYRHLLEDLRTLIPHHKKESKLDVGKSGSTGTAISEIAEMKSCNSVLYLECRKRQDCYMWIGRSSGGPSAKFLLNNVHTMDELRMTGNCMKGSRPILSFDSSFSNVSHLKLLKALFTDVFGTPRGHPKSKPFIDRIMSFYFADGMIWVRHYQIVQGQAENAKEAHLEKKQQGIAENTSLVEIGPRFVMNPIRIFRGAFGGQTLYQNPDYVSPNEIRAMNMKDKGNSYAGRKQAQKKRKTRKDNVVIPQDPLAHVFN
jgi:ribosome biogenesis protein BRX1